MALEILLPTPAVRNLIREDKVHQLPGLMTTGQDEHQMQTLNQSLARLYNAGRISFDAAMQCSADTSDLKDLIGTSEAGVTHLHLPAASRPLSSRLSL
jgi:twitching motility protein PilT